MPIAIRPSWSLYRTPSTVLGLPALARTNSTSEMGELTASPYSVPRPGRLWRANGCAPGRDPLLYAPESASPAASRGGDALAGGVGAAPNGGGAGRLSAFSADRPGASPPRS